MVIKFLFVRYCLGVFIRFVETVRLVVLKHPFCVTTDHLPEWVAETSAALLSGGDPVEPGVGHRPLLAAIGFYHPLNRYRLTLPLL
jgi:hypothetical protein